jgi:hypothetical protein
MEEAKLVWQVQIACAGVLAFLRTSGTNVDFSTEISMRAAACAVVLIGAVYNVLGNFYAWRARVDIQEAENQDNLIAPTFAIGWKLIFMLVFAGTVLLVEPKVLRFADLLFPQMALGKKLPDSELLRYFTWLGGAILGFILYGKVLRSAYGAVNRMDNHYHHYAAPLEKAIWWPLSLGRKK